VLSREFIQPLHAIAKKHVESKKKEEPIITAAQIATLFSNIELIYQLNQSFLKVCRLLPLSRRSS
jgi:hypothetical protein